MEPCDVCLILFIIGLVIGFVIGVGCCCLCDIEKNKKQEKGMYEGTSGRWG